MSLQQIFFTLALGGCLAVGLTLYVRHGHRRLYRELRQLREANPQALKPEDLVRAESELKQQFGEEISRLANEVVSPGIQEVSVRLQQIAVENQARTEELRQALRTRIDALEGWIERSLAPAHGQSIGLFIENSLTARHEQLQEQLTRQRVELQQERTQTREAQTALRSEVSSTARSIEQVAAELDQVRFTLAELQSTCNSQRGGDPVALRHLQRLQIDVEFVKTRLSSYLGEGTALTHLVDETPIYLNTSDIGCPANFINGGRYEEDYLQVLASFCRSDSVFLDVGANLGVFSLRLAPYLSQGRVHAFEPNARIQELFTRSVHLNGLRDRIEIHSVGASDESAELVLEVPQGHAGGGHLVRATANDLRAKIQVRPLDDLLKSLPAFHVAKIDVEGHELHALRGMRRLLARSPDAVVLFEKLIPHAGLEEDVATLFGEFGMTLWRINGVCLEPVELEAFKQGAAYFLAARPATIGDERDRGFVRITADHFLGPAKRDKEGHLVPPNVPVAPGGLLFHGPYWYLPRGVHRVTIEGTLHHDMHIQIAEKFGYAVADVTVSGAKPEFDFVADRDLTHFEIVGRAGAVQPAFRIASLRVRRIA